jgi:hypothetical protein
MNTLLVQIARSKNKSVAVLVGRVRQPTFDRLTRLGPGRCGKPRATFLTKLTFERRAQ